MVIPNRDVLLERLERLLNAYRAGELGGAVMPEDANPGLPKACAENYAYFTLPMALNYQRNSYALWKAACQSYLDMETRDVFTPLRAAYMDQDALREKLLKHKIALQPNKQPILWKTLCQTFVDHFGGDIRGLFAVCNRSVAQTKQYLARNKKAFPYLSGEKIMNYWLFVMQAYTDLSFSDRDQITVAPDTHVLQASVQLGLMTAAQADRSDAKKTAALRWSALLRDTSYQPIDVHTPLWLWSREKFRVKL